MKRLDFAERNLVSYANIAITDPKPIGYKIEKLIDHILVFDESLKPLRYKIPIETYYAKLIVANDARLVLNHLFRIKNSN